MTQAYITPELFAAVQAALAAALARLDADAKMPNPLPIASCGNCVNESSCKEHGVDLGPSECGEEYKAKDQNGDPAKEIADLRAKLELTQRDRAEQQRVAMECEGDLHQSKVEVATLFDHNKTLISERDKALARVAELERERDKWERAFHECEAMCHTTSEHERFARTEMQKALADLAAAKEDAERAKMERNGMHVKNFREWQEARAEADALRAGWDKDSTEKAKVIISLAGLLREAQRALSADYMTDEEHAIALPRDMSPADIAAWAESVGAPSALRRR